MSGPNYPDPRGTPTMNTDTDVMPPEQEKGRSWFWPAFIMLQAIQYLVSRLTGWPWWVLSAPVAAAAVVVVVYLWAKNRRREAEAAAG